MESLHLANSAKEIEKLADYKNTVGLLNKIEDKYYKLGKPVGAPFDPQRFGVSDC